MSGETNLAKLVAQMNPEASKEPFVFLSLPFDSIPRELEWICAFKEEEGMTIICTEAEAAKHALQYLGQYARITLHAHSSLEAVGFLAVVSQALADASIPCNVVSAFFHDHLFVPVEDQAKALSVLRRLQEGREAVRRVGDRATGI